MSYTNITKKKQISITTSFSIITSNKRESCHLWRQTFDIQILQISEITPTKRELKYRAKIQVEYRKLNFS